MSSSFSKWFDGLSDSEQALVAVSTTSVVAAVGYYAFSAYKARQAEQLLALSANQQDIATQMDSTHSPGQQSTSALSNDLAAHMAHIRARTQAAAANGTID